MIWWVASVGDDGEGADDSGSKFTDNASSRRKKKKSNLFEEATDKFKSEWEVKGGGIEHFHSGKVILILLSYTCLTKYS